jgi:hypothetical protein
MTHALNLTLPIKQDPETLKKLQQLEAIFPTMVQPKIEEALRKSRLVHFARVLVIDNKYIQVLTEYEGSHQEYTEFFRRELTPVFAAIFALADNMPDVNDPNGFFNFAKEHNIRALGIRPVTRLTSRESRPVGCSRPIITRRSNRSWTRSARLEQGTLKNHVNHLRMDRWPILKISRPWLSAAR